MPLTIGRLYFENAVGQLAEHPNGYALVQFKPGKRDFIDFQSFLTHLGHLLRRRGWYKILVNQRQMAPFTEEERSFVHQHWLAQSQANQPDMVAAVLLPEDVFARLSMNLVMNDAREGALSYHVFMDEVKAAAWLRQIS
jgi:hypothetical protein